MDRLNEGRMRWRGQEWNDVEKRRGMEKIIRMKRKSDSGKKRWIGGKNREMDRCKNGWMERGGVMRCRAELLMKE